VDRPHAPNAIVSPRIFTMRPGGAFFSDAQPFLCCEGILFRLFTDAFPFQKHETFLRVNTTATLLHKKSKNGQIYFF
jgi:hypothetical protein